MRSFNRPNSYGSLKEEIQPQQPQNPVPAGNDQQQSGEEKKDFTIVNNVEVRFNSTDSTDLQLKDDEKTKISGLIDAFRTEVSELTEFGKLNVYPDSVKLEGRVGNLNLDFMLSAGDDNGTYLSNTSLLKLTPEIMDMLNKLKKFETKFTDEVYAQWRKGFSEWVANGRVGQPPTMESAAKAAGNMAFIRSVVQFNAPIS